MPRAIINCYGLNEQNIKKEEKQATKFVMSK